MRVAFAALAALVLTAAGCSATTERPADDYVRGYLAAAAGAAADRGWSLLHPTARDEAFDGDALSYMEAAAASDWSRTGWEVGEAFEDDPGLWYVLIESAPPDDAVPTLLTRRWNNFQIWGGTGGVPGVVPRILVRYDDRGSGIWPFGG